MPNKDEMKDDGRSHGHDAYDDGARNHRAENGTRSLRLPLDPWRKRGNILTIVYPKLGNIFFLRIARALVVIWPLIWTANVLANDCQKFAVEGDHEYVGGDIVAEQHAHADSHSQDPDHDHEKPGSHGKGTGSCCCDKLTPAAAVILHEGFVPSDSRTQAPPPDLTLQCGVSIPLPVVQLAYAYSQPPPSRTPLFLLHLRLLV